MTGHDISDFFLATVVMNLTAADICSRCHVRAELCVLRDSGSLRLRTRQFHGPALDLEPCSLYTMQDNLRPCPALKIADQRH